MDGRCTPWFGEQDAKRIPGSAEHRARERGGRADRTVTAVAPFWRFGREPLTDKKKEEKRLAPPHAGLILCQGFLETQPVLGIGKARGGLRNEVVEIWIAVGGGGRVCWIGRTAGGCCVPVDGIYDHV